MSREDAWVQVFDTHQQLLERADAPAIDLDRESSAPRSIEEIVQDIERELANREQVGTPPLPDTLN